MPDREHLLIAALEARMRFLRTEISIANTMLDLVGTSRDATLQERRRSAARDAYAEVEGHLAAESANAPFEAADREFLTEGLRALRGRMAGDVG